MVMEMRTVMDMLMNMNRDKDIDMAADVDKIVEC